MRKVQVLGTYFDFFDKNLIFTFLGSLVFQILQIAAYPILLSQILNSKAYDPAMIGIFVSVSWVVILLASPFVPAIIRYAGHALANYLSFALTFFSLFIIYQTGQAGWLFASACLMGLGLIIRWINCDTLIVRLTNEKVRGRTIGFHEALMGLGIGIGPLLFIGRDLNSVILICIALAVVGQIFFLLTKFDGGEIVEDEEHATGKAVYALIPVALVAAFVAGLIENSAIALFPLHFEISGFPLAVSAVFVSSFGFGGTLLQPPLGWFADRYTYGAAQSLCVIVILLSCAFIVMFSMQSAILLVALFFLGGAGGGLNTLAVIEAGKTLSMRQMPAAMTAVAVFYTIGSITGPVFSGGVMDMAGNSGMIIFFAIASLLFGVMLVSRKKAR